MVHRRRQKVAKSFVTVVAGDLVPSAKSGDLLLFQVHLTLPHKSGKRVSLHSVHSFIAENPLIA